LLESLGIASNVLTDRLNRLLGAGVLDHVRYSERPERVDAATCTVASERTASSRSGKVEALSSNRAARIAQSDQSRVSTAAFRARVEDVEGGDRQMQQCPLVHPEGVTGRP
jgi:hypothetical protein